MIRDTTPCAVCSAGQAISTFRFALFALLLALAAQDADQEPWRRLALWLCATVSALAVIRFPLARLLARRLQGRNQKRRQVRLTQRSEAP